MVIDGVRVTDAKVVCKLFARGRSEISSLRSTPCRMVERKGS